MKVRNSGVLFRTKTFFIIYLSFNKLNHIYTKIMNSPGKYKSLDLQVVRDGSGVGAVMRGVEGFDFGDGSLEGAGLGHEKVLGDGGAAFGIGVEIEYGTVGFHVTITTRRDTIPAINGHRGERQIVDPETTRELKSETPHGVRSRRMKLQFSEFWTVLTARIQSPDGRCHQDEAPCLQ